MSCDSLNPYNDFKHAHRYYRDLGSVFFMLCYILSLLNGRSGTKREEVQLSRGSVYWHPKSRARNGANVLHDILHVPRCIPTTTSAASSSRRLARTSTFNFPYFKKHTEKLREMSFGEVIQRAHVSCATRCQNGRRHDVCSLKKRSRSTWKGLCEGGKGTCRRLR